MKVVCRVPDRGEVELAELLRGLVAAPPGQPYADDVVELCQQFGARLMADPVARVHPELMTLGFFMRKAELARGKREHEAAARQDLVQVPAGLVFHVPPANVDTIFMYSWLLSVLAGNTNVVRLSSRSAPVVDHLCALLDELLAAPRHADARARVAMIQYGHDDAITAAISAHAAIRVIWGGDATVATIRRAPLPPYGRDLTFADRWSLMALDAATVAALAPAELVALAEQLFNDIFWFDQAACSSPRLCLWIGTGALVATVRDRLWSAVADVATARGLRPEVALRMARELFVHQAVLDGPVVGRTDYGAALTVARVDRLDGLSRAHPGGGLLFEAIAPSLASLDRWVTRRDQTLTHFGFARHELIELAQRLAGRGIDRLVPVGQALHLARFWDGYDLLAQLVRNVHVVG
ncbi:MAG: gamma-glutamyl phosphate reductase [Myxococcales bacterium]|nr:gamma-glutamyl phosphate reductase [Myxococcales bacterium]